MQPCNFGVVLRKCKDDSPVVLYRIGPKSPGEVANLRAHASPELVARSSESRAGRIEYVDLLVFDHGRRTGYEFKYAEQPRVTRSMRAAMEDLRLDLLMVICPGTVRAQLAPGVEAMGIESFASGTPP